MGVRGEAHDPVTGGSLQRLGSLLGLGTLDLAGRQDQGLRGQDGREALQLSADGLEGLQRLHLATRGAVDQVQQHAAPFDMPQEPVADPRAVGRTLDQAGDVGDDELALVIAPEGSRSGSGEWKSGFYHIAMAANVPIVPAWVDHENLRGGIGEPLWPSGDYRADLAKLASFYREKRPDCARFLALEESARMMGGPDVARGENYGDRT